MDRHRFEGSAVETRPYLMSRTDNWATPPSLFRLLDAQFAFTLDPCANASNATCARYYTVDDDGLSKCWDGERVFMNPPYGRRIGAWMQKAATSKALVVALVPSRTDTKWWHEYVVHGGGIPLFLKGRLRFGDGSSPAPFPSAIVLYLHSVPYVR